MTYIYDDSSKRNHDNDSSTTVTTTTTAQQPQQILLLSEPKNQKKNNNNNNNKTKNLRLQKLQFQKLLHPSKKRKWPTAALQIQTGSLCVPIAFFDSLRYCSFLIFFEDLSNNFSSHDASLDLDFFQANVSKPAKLSCSILPKWRCMLVAQVSGISLTCPLDPG